MDTNYKNFCVNAILSQREVCCIADAMLAKCKGNDLDIPLSEEGRQALKGALSHFTYLVRSIPFPKVLPRYSTYAIDLFPDCLQLGIVSYSEDTKFDEFGYPCVDQEAEPNDENGEDDAKGPGYQSMLSIPIQTIPLKVWAKQNGVNRNTARAWVAQGRIKTFDDGSNECRVSVIQYLPDAPYTNSKILVRFRTPGVLPEKVTQKYPSLSGEVFDILFTSVKDGACSLLIVSRAGRAEKLSVQTLTIREDERAAMVRTLLTAGELRPSMDQCYQSPVGDPLSGAPYRYASLHLTAEDATAIKGLRVVGSCKNDTGVDSGFAIPSFSIDVCDKGRGTPICSIYGRVFDAKRRPEETLLMAMFDRDNLIECRNRVLAVVGDHKKGTAPWNRHILFLTKIEKAPDADQGIVVSAIRNLPQLAKRGIVFSPDLLIAPVPLDEPNLDSIVKLLTDCGFAEVQENKEEPYDDYRVFYAYATP